MTDIRPASANLDLGRALHGVQELLDLAMLMLDRHDVDGILHLLARSVRSVTRCDLVQVRLFRAGVWTSWPVPGSAPPDVAPTVRTHVERHGDSWTCTAPVAALGRTPGRLVLRSSEAPDPEQLFVIERLGHLLGAALADAELHERDRLRAVEVDRINTHLMSTVAALRQREAVQNVFTSLAATGGEEDLAASLSRLTGTTVVVRDGFGHETTRVLAADVPPGASISEPVSPARDPLIRRGDALIASIGGRSELGSVELEIGADNDDARFALQYASTALGLVKAHERAMREMQNRLSRDLLDDLLEGLPPEEATARARAQGQDLRVAHDVVVIVWPHTTPPPGVTVDRGIDRVQSALSRQGRSCLVTRRHGVIVVLARHPVDIQRIHDDLCRDFGRSDGQVAVGEPARAAKEIPRAHEQARRALAARQQSTEPYGATAYAGLGVERILATEDNGAEVERLIDTWLADLIDYDASHGTGLVLTLAAYLDHGGKYDETARALSVHRNTLRYRLTRIAEVSGHDLADVETRLNLHLASRAWRLRRAP
jgi:hypothetical protein